MYSIACTCAVYACGETGCCRFLKLDNLAYDILSNTCSVERCEYKKKIRQIVFALLELNVGTHARGDRQAWGTLF